MTKYPIQLHCAIPVVKSCHLPFEASYPACDICSREEIRILTKDLVECIEMNGVLYVSERLYNQMEYLENIEDRQAINDFFFLSKYKVFEDRSKIVFHIPINEMLFIVPMQSELISTKFKEVIVEQKAENPKLQIVTVLKHE